MYGGDMYSSMGMHDVGMGSDGVHKMGMNYMDMHGFACLWRACFSLAVKAFSFEI